MTSLIRLYPRAWRDRYGDEIADLVASGDLGLRGSIDLVRGALDAHRHPELVDPALEGEAAWTAGVSRRRLADLVVARRLGIVAILGAVAWIAGWTIAANGPLIQDGGNTYRSGEAGAPFVLLAMLLLSAGLVGQVIRLAPRTRAARAAAIVALIAGPLWGSSPWVLAIAAVIVAALLILAVAAWWAGRWSGLATLTVIASLGTATGSVFGLLRGAPGLGVLSGDPMFFIVMACTPIWLAIGATLLPLPPLDDRLEANPVLSGLGEPA